MHPLAGAGMLCVGDGTRQNTRQSGPAVREAESDEEDATLRDTGGDAAECQERRSAGHAVRKVAHINMTLGIGLWFLRAEYAARVAA